MKKSSYSLIFIGGCLACASCAGPGREDSFGVQSPAIIGGKATSAIPGIGALLKLDATGADVCTATLIAPRKLLTAAHCLQGVAAARVKFVIGQNAMSPERVLDAKRLVPHPGYSLETVPGYGDVVSNDVGLVLLAQDAPANVAPVPLGPALDDSLLGRDLLFMGYGTSGFTKVGDSYTEVGTGTKRYVVMPVSELRDDAFSFGGRERNICNGDSGAPVLSRAADGSYQVVGVVSAADTLCQKTADASRVDAYAGFINQPLD